MSYIDHGTARDYLITRIDDIDPELAAKVRRREVSAFAAARSLGLTKPRASLYGHNPEVIVKTLRRFLPPDALKAVTSLLAAQTSGAELRNGQHGDQG